jgi:NAD(P)-dependent dehydrogenase (short-subunit alcohol dehydrogenase family)
MSDISTPSVARPATARFADQIVICVGAASGMGLETATAFAREGARLVMADINPSIHEAFAQIVGDATTTERGFAAEFDVRSSEGCDELIARAAAEYGRVDVVSFFTGVVQLAGEVADLDDREWKRVLDINLDGCFHIMRAAARVMRKQRSGRIVAIASDWGRVGIALYSAYCVSKAGVIVLAQSLAEELAEFGVTVNTVSPGMINTSMHQQNLHEEAAARGMTYEAMRDQAWEKIPMKHAGEPRDIADAVLFLASDAARYITGSSIDVTGGLMRR